MVSVEFDPLGFSMKDLATRKIFLRSNSTGDLYPFQSAHGVSISTSTSSTCLFSNIWHSRLGQSGNAILNSLSSSYSIKRNKNPTFVCHSYPLGKHVKLSFVHSQFISTLLIRLLYLVMFFLTKPLSLFRGLLNLLLTSTNS